MSEFVTIRVWEDGYKELVHDDAIDFGNDREKLTAKCYKFYKSEEKSPWYFLEKAKEKIEVLERQNEIMREALEFYRDRKHFEIVTLRGEIIEYDVDAGPLCSTTESLIVNDRGEVATTALKEIKEME